MKLSKKSSLLLALSFSLCAMTSTSIAKDGFPSTAFNKPVKSPFSVFSSKKKNEETSNEKKNEEKEDIRAKVTENIVDTGEVFESSNQLGVTYIETKLKLIEDLMEHSNFIEARYNINSILEWVEDSTEYHTDLYRTLKKVENSEKQANVERDLAIKFAVLRDKTLYLDAKVLANEGKDREAVKKLVEVVRSQPKTDLGFKAYEMLEKLGFTYTIKCNNLDDCIE